MKIDLKELYEVTLAAVIVAIIAGIILCAWVEISEAGDLSPHFSKKEFNQKHVPIELSKIKVDPKLIQRLEALRQRIGKPIRINSGYRSPEYNSKVGGAKHSQHMTGKAADIVVEGMTAKQLEPIAREVGFTFTQTYPHLPHLHVDVR